MKRILIALALIAACASLAGSAQAGHGMLGRGPLMGYRSYDYSPSYYARTDMSRGFYGYGYGRGYGYGPNFSGSGGFYGRENYGPGTGVYYRVPGGSGVYGF